MHTTLVSNRVNVAQFVSKAILFLSKLPSKQLQFINTIKENVCLMSVALNLCKSNLIKTIFYLKVTIKNKDHISGFQNFIERITTHFKIVFLYLYITDKR